MAREIVMMTDRLRVCKVCRGGSGWLAELWIRGKRVVNYSQAKCPLNARSLYRC